MGAPRPAQAKAPLKLPTGTPFRLEDISVRCPVCAGLHVRATSIIDRTLEVLCFACGRYRYLKLEGQK